ncbi:MAG: thioesterase [Ancylobacter novellus]|uniref:Thioesterase n=1 Tax=Ancylobacter novellus TaxID=921 RepID=A0A2W5QP39_ANCNO|nr:MAG: thioesterase [Ancylobacter novellus]
MDEHRRFRIRFRARDADIDELGHVNNAVWVIWIQDASVAHWLTAARPQDRDRFVAVVLRHEVDYRGNVRAGDTVSATTWVVGAPRGARYVRRVEFHDEDGRTIVASLTQWALVDRETGKLARVPVEVAAPFLVDDTTQKEIE